MFDLPAFIWASLSVSGAASGITPLQPANLLASSALFAGTLIVKITTAPLLLVAKAILQRLHRFFLPLRVSRVLTLMLVSTVGINLIPRTLLVVVSGNIVSTRDGFTPGTLDFGPWVVRRLLYV